MRVPSWETSSGALGSFLNASTAIYMADLYTFTLAGGGVLRYTSADHACIVNGTTWQIGPAIARGKTRLIVGVQVDNLDVTLAADASVTVGSVPLLPWIVAGGLDGARLQLDRAFAAGPPQYGQQPSWIGMLPMFSGRCADVQASRYEAKVVVHSDLELLDSMLPRNVYQPGCSNTLFDGACGLAKSAYVNTATASSSTDALRRTFASNLTQTDGYFDLGWAVGVVGANGGVGRTVKTYLHSGGSLTVIQPWPSPVSVGDTFSVYAGCDKSLATCSAKFGNASRFRGQPFVPAPETVI